MSISLKRAVLMMLVTGVCSSVAGGVTIVGHNGKELPISKTTSAQHESDKIQPIAIIAGDGSASDETAIKTALLDEFGSLEDIILASDNLSTEQRTVVRKMLFEKRKTELLELNNLKHQAKLEEIQEGLAKDNELYAAKNDPNAILNKRKTQDAINAAQTTPLYDPKVSITTTPFDPESNGRIVINSTMNNPSAITFYDEMGSMFKITKKLPESNKVFHIEPVNETTLVISAKKNHEQVSGFVFLENVHQPIPITYKSIPTEYNDTRANFILPMISPESKEQMESLTVDVSKVKNDESDPVMYRFIHRQPVPKAKRLEVEGLPASTQAWLYKGFVYFRTKQVLQYDIQHAVRLGTWYVFKAYKRASYWFSSNNRDVEVFVYEPK